MSKQQTNNKQQTVAEAEATTETVAQCERVFAELTERRTKLIERLGELERERGRVAYDALAHVGDGAAGKLLDKTIAETVKHAEHVKALDDALREAGRRLAAARQHEAQAADRQRALAAARAAEKCWEHGAGIEAALVRLREHINGRYEALRVMHQNGLRYPSFEQQDGLFYRRVVGVMYDTPLRPRFEVVPPGERAHTVTAVDADSWKPMVERNLAPRLGDGEQQTATEPEAA
jgi:hypothetical protein